MQVAIVHDYLNQYGGAERVLEALHELFPDAPVYTSLYDPEAMPDHFRTWQIRTSWMQHLPAWRRLFREYFLFYPSAFEAFDLREFDLVLSSSSAFAKGVIPAPNAVHICYCHTPMRFAWRTNAYVERERIVWPLRPLLALLLPHLRNWDITSTPRVDHFVANSRAVGERIKQIYKRSATIIPPPVDLPPYHETPAGDYYLTGGRLVPYKRIDLVIRACNELHRPLKIFGGGRDRAELEAIAGPTIEFLGHVDENERRALFDGCRAFVFPGEEDFGITPLEAMAAGRPVIAYAAGGALDTVVEGKTGHFFHQQTVEALCEAMLASEQVCYQAQAIRRHAEGFGRDIFLQRMRETIDEWTSAPIPLHSKRTGVLSRS
jgi:glycosyltransferase involved in cell wall biosynthesis